MRFTKKKFDDFIASLVGPEGLEIVEKLKSKKNVSEFDLANELKIDIKVVRRLLYKLFEHNLVNSTRKKDKQKGWYIYYWTLLPENVKYFYEKKLRERLARLEEKLHREETEYYFTCPKRCVRLDFNQSLDFGFRCPECGDLIAAYDQEQVIAKLKEEIEKLKKELEAPEATKKKETKKSGTAKTKKRVSPKKTPTKKKVKKEAGKKKTTAKKKPQKEATKKVARKKKK
jgi:transcription initiation factor TFIIE subunit alpha